jgi:hypothetical protein
MNTVIAVPEKVLFIVDKWKPFLSIVLSNRGAGFYVR